SSNDRVGLAAFNTFYTQLSPIIGSTEHAANALSLIQEPNDQEKYTDLFAALLAAGSEMQDQQGRRVIIALSDGVNETYSQSTGEEHPEYGNREFSPQQVSRAYIEEGTTLYAIHFGVIQEAELHTIVENTGGRVYEAENANQLLGVYDSIREQVTSEYRITYTPAPAAADSVEVTVRARRTQGSRVYFAPLMFGPAGGLPIWLLAIVFAAALIIWILLMALKFEKKIKNPSLNVLPTPGTVVSAQTIDLSSGKTVIGGKENCDLTISGTEPVSAEAATILFDEKLNAYTIQGDANVNNRPVKRRKLTDGDVISVGGTVIVFDEPEKPEKETEK
ncbi:MAG: VWA domain-containing protein, partial [Spirochaetia bacterium]